MAIKQILFFLVSFISYLGTFSQSIEITKECATELTVEQAEYLEKIGPQIEKFSSEKSGQKTTLFFPVQHHIVRQSNGSGGLAPAEIGKIMQELNHHYATANMVFYQCAPVNFIDESIYYNFSSSQENALAAAHDVSNVINIYYFNSATSGGVSVCGYSRFPPSADRVIMVNSCATNGSTIVHELGHYFSLYHTHGKTNFGTTDELVNGSNCSVAGDDICDTPADPNLDAVVNTTCDYTGTAVDANSQSYNPQTNNIMSYSRKSCRTLFTTGQMNRVEFAAINFRNYLTCTSPMAPQVDFAVNTTLSCDGIIEFYDLSSSLPSNWLWDFGDGSTSNIRNPIHVYSSNGLYTVSLKVSNSGGADSVVQTNLINVSLPAGPSVDPVDSICKGESASLVANSGGNVYWYNDEISTMPLATGHNFSTPILTSTKTYYSSAVFPNAILSAGPGSNSIGTSSFYSAKEFLIFNALKPFTLKSVKVFAGSSGDRVIELRNSIGLILSSKTVNISAGQQTVVLDFEVPMGDDLQLGLSTVSDVDLSGNTSGTSYPYVLPGLVEITSSSNGTNRYYFFYDWKVQANECISKRVPVTIGVKNCVSTISEREMLSEIDFYPNPNNGKFTVHNEHFESLECEILNTLGKSVYNAVIEKGNINFDLSHLQSGLYFVRFNYGKTTSVKKLIIRY